MNVVAWVLQIVLAVLFLGAGLAKATQPRDKLAATPNLAWAGDFSPGAVKAIGVVEILAALGLVLPAATRIAPVLTPLAATGLVLVMAGAIVVHARRGEKQTIGLNVVLLVLAAVVAWARFGPYALS